MNDKLLEFFFNAILRQSFSQPVYQSVAIKLVNYGILWDISNVKNKVLSTPVEIPILSRKIQWSLHFKNFTVDSRPSYLRRIDYLAGLTSLIGHYPELFPSNFEQ